MKFLFPSFLFALFAIAIPIIIHLFNFRKYKKIYFPNVRFLQEIKQQTQAKSKLKHLLILASRILAITFLVFAFAQPYIPLSEKEIDKSEKVISVFIDNSFSMEAVNNNGLLLTEAQKRAKEIINAYQPDDQFQILTNDFEGRHQRLVSKDEFVELLEEIKISPSVRSFSEIISRQKDLLNSQSGKTKIAYVISDFQKNFIDAEKFKNDTSITFNLIPVEGLKSNNLFIDSVWFTNPVRQLNQTEELMVRIRNSSENNLENIPLKLFINDQQKAPASFSIEANSSIEFKLNYTNKETGIHYGSIKLNDYPVSYDDDFYFSYSISPNIKVLVVNDESESSYLNSLYGKDSLFILKNVNEKSIDYSTIGDNQLIILNELKTISSGLAQELKRFTENGGSLVVFPAAAAELQSYSDFLTALNADYYVSLDTVNQKVSKINLDHEIFKNVFAKIPENIDLPLTQSHFTLTKNPGSVRENLLQIQNGDAFLNLYSIGKGKLYLYSVSLKSEFSNFPKHALFVPIMYKTGVLSEPATDIFYTIGKNQPVEIKSNKLSGENVYHLIHKATNYDIIPLQQVSGNKSVINVNNQVSSAGNYSLTNGTETVQPVSYNYDRKESDMAYYKVDELKEAFSGFNNLSLIKASEKSLTETINEINLGTGLWKLCIILALLFLGVEVLLLRFL